MTFIPDYMYYYYPDLVVNDAQDWTTWTLNLVSSLISALACATIIYVIFRSAQGLSTTYHRIMAYFATSLMIANIVAGLGTIPMPKDNIYPFKGPSLGNDATCTAQALILVFVLINHVLCNVHLAWYYVAILVLKLKEKTVERYVEPFMLITNLAFSISISVYFYKVDYYHVDPLLPYCSPARYPFHCTWIPGEECDDNGTFMYTAEGYDALVKGSNIFLYVVFSLVVLAMLIIIVNTLMFERNLLKRKELSSTSHGKSSSDGRRTQISGSSNEKVSGIVEDGSRGNSEVGITASDLKFTRIVSFQATLYIVSFLISYSPTVASLAKDYPENGLVAYWRIFIANFQGVFVLIIFLYHKVHNIRRRQRDNTIMDALATVFLKKDIVDDFFVENLTLVQESDNIRKRRAAAQEEELENAEAHMETSKSDKSSKIANSAELELYDGISFSSPSRPESERYDNISFGTSNVHETSLNNNNSSNAMSFGQVSSSGILSYGPEGTVNGRKSSPEIENGNRYYDIDLKLDEESC